MKRLLGFLVAVALALPVAADTQVVCSISEQAATTCSAISVSQAAALEPCRCTLDDGGDGDAGPFGGHATLADGLVSYWALDEESGTRVDSVVATGNDLTDNTVGFDTGINANAASLVAASSEYFSVADADDSLDPGNTDFSWSLWIYPTVSGGTDYFLGKAASCSTVVTPYYLVQNPSGTVTFGVATGAGETTLTSTATLNIDAWNHVLAVHTADADMLIGINGVEKTRGSAPVDPYQNTAQVTFGTLSSGCPDSIKWTGRMDEIGFWPRALTAQERTDLYNSGAGLFYGN